jgi:predicted metalloprotease with PDZ domain
VKEIDSPKYLAYAGLAIDVGLKDTAGVYLGATTTEQEGTLVITGVEWNSPAWRDGLSEQDEIIALDGARVRNTSDAAGTGGSATGAAAAPTMGRILKGKKPGEKALVLISRRGKIRELEVVLGRKPERSFAIMPVANPTPLQAAILKDWLRE